MQTMFVIFFHFFIMNLFATNGVQSIGVSAASLSMGGVGLSSYLNGSEALFKNNALLHKSRVATGGIQLELNSTLLKARVTAEVGTGEKESQAGALLLPNLAATYKLSETSALGLGIFAYGGANVNYGTEAALTKIHSQFRLVKILPTYSFEPHEKIAVGISPSLIYGDLAVNEAISSAGAGPISTRNPHSSLGVGVQVGVYSKPFEKLSLGASFHSKTKLKYDNITNLDLLGLTPDASIDPLTVTQPAEFALGGAYEIIPEWMAELNIRYIGWSDADGYKHFGWKNQTVFGLGTQYTYELWRFRAGFNVAPSPIESVSGEDGLPTVDIQGHPILTRSASNLNLVAFPAIAVSHLTLGAGYQIEEAWAVDFAFLYSPKSTITRSGTLSGTPYSYTATLSHWSLSLGVSHTL